MDAPGPVCDDSWMKAFFADGFLAQSLRFNPAEMTAEIEALQRIRRFVANASPQQVDGYASYAEPGYSGSYSNAAKLLFMSAWDADDALEYIARVASARGVSISDDCFEKIAKWVESGADLAGHGPEIAGIPEASELVRRVVETGRLEFAREVLSAALAPSVLKGDFTLPTSGEGRPGKAVELWVWVAPDSNNIEPQNPDVFVLSAVLVVRADDTQRGEVIAGLGGVLVPTIVGGKFNNGAALFEVMDAHSQLLNDVWKTVKAEVLPALGAQSVLELAGRFTLGGGSICVPWVVVSERHRGNGLGEFMLRAVAATIESADSCSWPCEVSGDDMQTYREMTANESVDGDDDEDWDDDEEWTPQDGMANPGWITNVLIENPIVLMVLAIEGTVPETSRVVNATLRSSTAKEGPRRVVDEKAEIRRRKLTKYFLAMNETKQRAFHVHTYNPWDYPNT